MSQMSWHELQTRVRQEVNKRLDLALWRSGLMTGRNGLVLSHAERGKFFFSVQDLPRLAQILNERLPDEVSKIVDEADEICRHRFCLLGYDNLNFGAEIDWHLDPVHGKRAPLKPWFDIDFLDFGQVGDHKVIWELNRHQHLVTLAKAWCLTHERSYVAELISQWYSWREANPYPLGINWGSSLEVAFRSLSWIWVHHLIGECAVPHAEFESDLVHGLAAAGRHIERYLSTYFSPNTHLLGEAVALFFIGSLYPQIGPARRWRDKGRSMLLEESERQVRSDGVYFEQALYYHVYALDFFLHARVLAGKNAVEIPSSFDQTILKMLDFLRALSQAGPPQSFGDDDGGRAFNPRRNRSEYMSDPLAIGAVLFQNADLISAATLTEESIWLLGQRAISLLTANAGTSLTANAGTSNPVSRSFEAAGIHLMADSVNGTQQVIIDAGPQGTGRSGHGHADALSIQLSLKGQPWLVDSGTGCYISRDGARDRFRGTAAHNTLRVDGQDQAIAEGPFAWSCLPAVKAERWIQAKTFNLFIGNHFGYTRLADPVVHRRFIFHLAGDFWLIRDVADAEQVHSVETFWHFHPELAVTEVAGNFLITNTKSAPGDPAVSLALAPLRDDEWTTEIIAEQVSPAYGRFESAPVVRCQARVKLPAEHAIVITPLFTGDEPGHLTRIPTSDGNSAATILRYDAKRATHFAVFAAKLGDWKAGLWRSDASFLYCCVKEGRVTQFIICDSSFADVGSSRVFTHPRKLEWLDWEQPAGESHMFTSEENVVLSFAQSVLTSCTLSL